MFLAWLVIALIALSPTAASKTEAVALETAEVVTPSPEEIALHERREAWLKDLEMCESSGIPTAVNPNDLDGTPSYGAFQFKPSTFDAYVKKYGIAVPPGENFMHRETQIAIIWRMMDDPAVRWHREFPDCVEKYGPPPR